MSNHNGIFRKLDPTIIFSITIITISTVIRIKFATSQAIFIDEAANVPESLVFTLSLFKTHPELSNLAFDIIKPVFYRIVFGLFGVTGQFLINGSVSTQNSGILLSLLYERIGVILLSDFCILVLLFKLSKRHKIASMFLVLFTLSTPSVQFALTIVETPTLIIPFTMLLIYYVATADILQYKSMLPISFLIAILMSTQYYSFIFIISSLASMLLIISIRNNGESNQISIKRTLMILFIFLILLPLFIFFTINPSFWINPINFFLETVRNIAFPFFSGSGVYNLPIFFSGSSLKSYPWYSPLTYLLFQVPVLFSLLILSEIIIITEYFLRRLDGVETFGNKQRIVVTSLFFLSLSMITVVFIPHLRGFGAFVPIVYPSILFLAAIGAADFYATIVRKVKIMVPKTFNLAISQKKSIRNKTEIQHNEKVNLSKLIVVLSICIILLVPYISFEQPSFNSSNIAGTIIYKSGSNISGAYASGQADMSIAKYMLLNSIQNKTVISLSLTTDIELYDPNNSYIQLWPMTAPVNSSYLLNNYFNDYIVIDSWFTQLYGNPLSNNLQDFTLIKIVKYDSLYSKLYRISPANYLNKTFLIKSINILLMNNNTYSTPQIYNQKIVVNSSYYKQYEFKNLTNVEFSYSNGKLIPSWLEKGFTNNCNRSIYFLRLNQKILGGENITIHLDFMKNYLQDGLIIGQNSNLEPRINNARFVFNAYISTSQGVRSNYYTLLKLNNHNTIEHIDPVNNVAYSFLGSNNPISGRNTVIHYSFQANPSNGSGTIISFTPWSPKGVFPEIGMNLTNSSVVKFYFENYSYVYGNINNSIEFNATLYLSKNEITLSVYGPNGTTLWIKSTKIGNYDIFAPAINVETPVSLNLITGPFILRSVFSITLPLPGKMLNSITL